MSNNNLLDLSIDELTELFVSESIPKFRAKQVYGWMLKGYDDFYLMPNLPKQLQSQLSEKHLTGIPKVLKKQVSKLDGTMKYLLGYADGNIIECVVMEYKHGLTICISSQVGCKMGCKFCASTGLDFARNLTAGEMIGQIVAASRDCGKRISNVVIMGIGEPFDNFDNLISFFDLVNNENNLNIGQRHITVSTCGLVDKIVEFADMHYQVNLSISLHATSDVTRSEIMPINKKYNIFELINACKYYIKKTNRRITFEYALIKGVNDGKDFAQAIVNLLKGMLCHVNLIPVNEISSSGYTKSSREVIETFCGILKKNGIPATVRRELGSDISAACGQLRRDSFSGSD